MTDLIWALRGVEGVVLVLGAGIAWASLRAYRRTRRVALAYLGVGFLLVSVAAGLAGVLYELFTHDLLSAWTVSASLDAIGFALILYSIVRPEPVAEAASHDGTPPASGAG